MSNIDVCNLALDGKLSEVINEFEKNAELIRTKDTSGRTTLHWAACGGHLELVKHLINNGLLIDEPDDVNWTPLMIAVSAGRGRVVQYLLKTQSVNVNIINSTGQCMMHYAASKNHLGIAHQLLLNGANPEVRDWIGDTPLHRAVSKGHIDMVKLLLAGWLPSPEEPEEREPVGKCSPNTANKSGQTAVHYACEEGNIELVRILLASGGNLEIKDKKGKSPIDLATDNLRVAMYKELKLSRQS